MKAITPYPANLNLEECLADLKAFNARHRDRLPVPYAKSRLQLAFSMKNKLRKQLLSDGTPVLRLTA